MKPPKMLDNKRNGSVADELRENISKGSKLSVMTAYFTIYAFAELKKELMKVDGVRMLFTDPIFIKNEEEPSREYYINHPAGQALSGNQYEIKLRNEMCQASVARECAQWLERKAQVKMFTSPKLCTAAPCLYRQRSRFCLHQRHRGFYHGGPRPDSVQPSGQQPLYVRKRLHSAVSENV